MKNYRRRREIRRIQLLDNIKEDKSYVESQRKMQNRDALAYLQETGAFGETLMIIPLKNIINVLSFTPVKYQQIYSKL